MELLARMPLRPRDVIVERRPVGPAVARQSHGRRRCVPGRLSRRRRNGIRSNRRRLRRRRRRVPNHRAHRQRAPTLCIIKRRRQRRRRLRGARMGNARGAVRVHRELRQAVDGRGADRKIAKSNRDTRRDSHARRGVTVREDGAGVEPGSRGSRGGRIGGDARGRRLGPRPSRRALPVRSLGRIQRRGHTRSLGVCDGVPERLGRVRRRIGIIRVARVSARASPGVGVRGGRHRCRLK